MKLIINLYDFPAHTFHRQLYALRSPTTELLQGIEDTHVHCVFFSVIHTTKSSVYGVLAMLVTKEKTFSASSALYCCFLYFAALLA